MPPLPSGHYAPAVSDGAKMARILPTAGRIAGTIGRASNAIGWIQMAYEGVMSGVDFVMNPENNSVRWQEKAPTIDATGSTTANPDGCYLQLEQQKWSGNLAKITNNFKNFVGATRYKVTAIRATTYHLEMWGDGLYWDRYVDCNALQLKSGEIPLNDVASQMQAKADAGNAEAQAVINQAVQGMINSNDPAIAQALNSAMAVPVPDAPDQPLPDETDDPDTSPNAPAITPHPGLPTTAPNDPAQPAEPANDPEYDPKKDPSTVPVRPVTPTNPDGTPMPVTNPAKKPDGSPNPSYDPAKDPWGRPVSPTNPDGSPMPVTNPAKKPDGSPNPAYDPHKDPYGRPVTPVNPDGSPMPVTNPATNPDGTPNPSYNPQKDPWGRPVTTPVTNPTTNPSSKPSSSNSPKFELPPFCSWASKVCAWIDWTKEKESEIEKGIKSEWDKVVKWFTDKPDDDKSDDDKPENKPKVDTQVSFGGACPSNAISSYYLPYIGSVSFTLFDWSKWCSDLSTYVRPVVILLFSYFSVLVFRSGS